jgi:uncharacterized HAD superfamily protein
MKQLVIAIDFDGTIVDNEYPSIGRIKPNAKRVINNLYNDHAIIVWTSRTGRYQSAAEQFLKQNGIKYHRINESAPINLKLHKIDTRKIGAHIYIDDCNLGCEKIDWKLIEKQIKKKVMEEVSFKDRIKQLLGIK